RDRGDHIYARRATTAGWSGAERITEEKADLLRAVLGEDASGRIHVIWSERSGEDWNLFERRFDRGSWSRKTALTTGPGTNIHHRIAADSRGNLHLVWIAHRGGKSYLSHSRFSGEVWSPPQDISGPGAWSPDAAVDEKGNLYAVWDSYRSGNYDIYLRRIDSGGLLGPIQQVTQSPRFQAHPSVAVDSLGRPWVAWDESGVNWGKDWTHENPYRATTLYADRKISLAVLDGGEWKQPTGDPGVSAPVYLRRYIQLPRIRFDSAGRLWMMFQSRSSVGANREDYWANNGRWDAYVTSLSGDRWAPSVMLPESTCRLEAPFDLVRSVKGGMHLVWPTDNRPFMPAGFAAPTAGQYEVYMSRMVGDATAGPAELESIAAASGPAAQPVAVHPDENAEVDRIRSHRVSYGGKELRILRGDFHRHTDISNDGAGDGSVEDFYRYMIDAAQMDTGIIGDHNMGGDLEYNWWRTEKSYDVYHIRDGFTPLF
ncbi:MAG: TolB family protein, partial [Gammaproteobacteria bacterium]